jgi:hypothetical protein
VDARSPCAPLLAVALAAAALAAPRGAAARDVALPDGQSAYLQLEAFGAALNDGVGGSTITASLGYGGRGGWRLGMVGFFAEFARDHWLTTEVATELTQGVLGLGAGAELLYANGRLRTSAAGGSATLLFDAAFHDKGTTGFYVDLRPLALRFRPAARLVVELTPIGFALVAPAVGELAIRRIEYRTTLTLEVPL